MNEIWWATPLWKDVTPRSLLLAAIVLVGAWAFSRFVLRAAWLTGPGKQIEPSVRYSLTRLIHYAVMVMTLLVVLNVLGVGLGTLALLAGALGIGVGFGLQTIFANFLSGLILLFERPIRVGDRVSLGTLDQDAVGQVNGYVRAIRLRATLVETPDNISLIVPNSEFVTRTIVNWSLSEPRMRLRLRVGVAYDTDLDRARHIMAEAARAHPVALQQPEPEVRLVDTAESRLELELLVWIPEPRLRGRIESDLRLDLVRRFRAAGVVIPFPQREVRMLGEPGGRSRT
jgi:small-conductance mechanosensitive channel